MYQVTYILSGELHTLNCTNMVVALTTAFLLPTKARVWQFVRKGTPRLIY
jgi:hypothetical protein